MSKIISAEETYPVRHSVLREGKPLDSCRFEGDKLATTFHLGIFESQKLVGVVTLLVNHQNPKEKINQGVSYQLRGMAVLKDYQHRGYGRQLVIDAETRIRQEDGVVLWCNAREIAVPFYKKLGFSKIGDAFQVPKIGLHYTMQKFL